ncbi:MAG: hypothetical protein AAGU75_23415, partial [Bacillota bacterium]
IIESDPDNTIVRTISVSDFQIPLTLANINDTSNYQIYVKLGPLSRSDGVVGLNSTLSWNSEGQKNNPLSLNAGQRRILTLTGSIPYDASYTGWITLEFNGTIKVYELKILKVSPPNIIVQEAVQDKILFDVNSPSYQFAISTILNPSQSEI